MKLVTQKKVFLISKHDLENKREARKKSGTCKEEYLNKDKGIRNGINLSIYLIAL